MSVDESGSPGLSSAMRDQTQAAIQAAARPSVRLARWLARAFPARVRLTMLLVGGAISLLLFAVSLATLLSWQGQAVWLPPMWLIVGSGAIGMVTGITALSMYCATSMGATGHGAREHRPEHDHMMFLRYQLGLGFALLVVAIFSAIVAAGLGHRLLPEDAQAAAATPVDPNLCGLRLLLAINMSILGALFFVANSLRKKSDCKSPFDANRFWGGLWYRMGEAVLFSLVFFLVIRSFRPKPSNHYAPPYDFLLPIVGLLMGMFIQTGERLVFGLAERVFAAASSLLPIEPDIRSPNARRASTLVEGPSEDEPVEDAASPLPGAERHGGGRFARSANPPDRRQARVDGG